MTAIWFRWLSSNERRRMAEKHRMDRRKNRLEIDRNKIKVFRKDTGKTEKRDK